MKKIGEIYEMEDTLAQDKSNIERFQKTWQPWLVFKYSQDPATHTKMIYMELTIKGP